MIAAAATIEEAIKLGNDAITQRDGENVILENSLTAEKEAHNLTKLQSAEIIADLKDQLAIANANIGSESPIISYKGKKWAVGSTRFHLPKDTKECTLEDLKKGKESNTLIERILAIKGQGILSEATA